MPDWKEGQKAYFNGKHFYDFHQKIVTITKEQWQWVNPGDGSIHYLVQITNDKGQPLQCNINFLKDPNDILCCSKCGSTDIFYATWVNPNTKEEHSNPYVGLDNLENWCEGHKDLISIKQTIPLLDYKKQDED